MYGKQREFTQFTGGRFEKKHKMPVRYCGDTVCVEGTMDSSYKSKVKISVFPKVYDNLNDAVKGKINKTDYERKF